MKNPVSHHHFDDFESTLRLAVAHGVEHHVGMRGLTGGTRELTRLHPVPRSRVDVLPHRPYLGASVSEFTRVWRDKTRGQPWTG